MPCPGPRWRRYRIVVTDHRSQITDHGEEIFDELDSEFFWLEPAHERAEIVAVAGRAEHGVHERRVALADELDHFIRAHAGSSASLVLDPRTLGKLCCRWVSTHCFDQAC